MSKNKRATTTLMSGLLSGKGEGKLTLSSYLAPLAIAPVGSRSSSRSLQSGAEGLKSLSTGSSERLQSIAFGKPSSNTSSQPASAGASWGNLLSNTIGGGASAILGNGFSGLLGLGGLFSGLAGLFGGSSKSQVQPLTLFSLPDSVQQTSYVAGQRTSATNTVLAASDHISTSGIYSTAPGGASSRTGANTLIDNTAIAQAVKNALLTSSTLADVISEI